MFLKKKEEGKYHIMLNFSVNCNWLLTYSMYKLLKSKLFDFLIKKKKKTVYFWILVILYHISLSVSKFYILS